jgi:hypothetical protein
MSVYGTPRRRGWGHRSCLTSSPFNGRVAAERCLLARAFDLAPRAVERVPGVRSELPRSACAAGVERSAGATSCGRIELLVQRPSHRVTRGHQIRQQLLQRPVRRLVVGLDCRRRKADCGRISVSSAQVSLSTPRLRTPGPTSAAHVLSISGAKLPCSQMKLLDAHVA